MRCWTIRWSSPFAVLRSADRLAVDADGDLPADDVSEVPLPAGLRDPVPGGRGLYELAPVLRIPLDAAVPHPTMLMNVDHPLRHGGGRRVQRGAAGQGRRGQAATH